MMMFLFYNMTVILVFILACPFAFLYLIIKGLLDQHLKERLGFLPAYLIPPKGSGLRIWLHAVSIGEVRLAKGISEAIRERGRDVSIILSTTTKSGRQTARSLMPPDTIVIYNPIDLVWCARRALRKASPHLFINLETEIWPNLLWACKLLRIPAFLINGRISVRSINAYKRVRVLMKEALASYASLSMISSADARRIIAIGADPRRVVVGGNAKYDSLVKEATPRLSRRTASVYRFDRKRPVFIAGSTRGGEEEIIIEAYLDLRARYSGMLLIIAPRHIERRGTVEELLRSFHLDYHLRSSLPAFSKKDLSADSIIVDTFGELFGLYGIGTVLFCGGSLVPLGGQNPLEAAVWGKPVLYGPSMEDFLDAKTLLEGVGAGFTVRDRDEIVKTATWLLDNPEQYERLGRKAREEIKRRSGSAKKQVEHIFKVFNRIREI